MSASLLLTLILVSGISGLDFSSFLGLPQLRSVTTPETPVVPEVVEIIRWRQPICIVPGIPGKFVPPCAFSYPPYSSTQQTVHVKKTLNTGEIRSNIGIDELEPSSIIQSTDEIREKIDETPALEDAVNVRRAKRELFGSAKHSVDAAAAAAAADAKRPPPIFVTKVLNSPVTATLVAQNCFPDIGVPLCVPEMTGMTTNFKTTTKSEKFQIQFPYIPASHDVNEFVNNSTGDAEEHFHRNVNEPVLLPTESNNLTESDHFHEKKPFVLAFLFYPKSNVTLAGQTFQNNPGQMSELAVLSIRQNRPIEKGIVAKKHELLQSIVQKKQAEVQGLVDKSNLVLETISNAAAEKKAVVQGVIDKKHDVIQGIVEKKQAALQAIVDKKNQLVEKKQAVIASITDSLSQKKDSVVQAIADKQAAIKGMVEKTQSVVQGFIDKKLALEMDIASRGQSLVQNIVDKKQNLIQDIADKKHTVIQHLADKKTDAIKAISEKTQEIIGTVSVMKPLLIGSIQQNLGLAGTKDDFDPEATTGAKDDDIVFDEEPNEPEPMLDERSAANSSVVAETEATTTEYFYQVVGSQRASGRSARSVDDGEYTTTAMIELQEKEDPEPRTFKHLKKIFKKPGFSAGKPGLLGIFHKPENPDAAAHKPNSLLSSLLGGVFNHRKPASNDNIAISTSSAQAAAIVTGSGDPVTAEQEAEVTTALLDKEQAAIDEPEGALNSSSARPPFQSLSLPAFAEEIVREEEEPDRLQVVDNSFAPMSKDPPAELSFAPITTTEDDDEPIVIDYEPTTARQQTKPIVPIADSDERPVVLSGNAKPDGTKDCFVIIGDVLFVDDKLNASQERKVGQDAETLQEM